MPERRKNRKWWSTSSSTILSQLKYMLPDGKDLVCLLTTECSTSKPVMAHITHLINMFWMNAQISVKHNLTRQASWKKTAPNLLSSPNFGRSHSLRDLSLTNENHCELYTAIFILYTYPSRYKERIEIF